MKAEIGWACIRPMSSRLLFEPNGSKTNGTGCAEAGELEQAQAGLQAGCLSMR